MIEVRELINQEIGKAKEDIEKEVHKVVDSRLTELKTKLKTRINWKLARLEAKIREIINGPGDDTVKIEQITAIKARLSRIQLNIQPEVTIRNLFIFVNCADDLIKYNSSRQAFQKKLKFLETKFKGMDKAQLDPIVSQVDKRLNVITEINQTLVASPLKTLTLKSKWLKIS